MLFSFIRSIPHPLGGRLGALTATVIIALFSAVAFLWTSLSIIAAKIGPIYGVLALLACGGILTLSHAGIWYRARDDRIEAWRCLWAACTILFLVMGVANLPAVRQDRLHRSAIAALMLQEPILERDTTPLNPTVQVEELKVMRDAEVLHTAYQYELDIQKTKRGRDGLKVALSAMLISALCALCASVPERQVISWMRPPRKA